MLTRFVVMVCALVVAVSSSRWRSTGGGAVSIRVAIHSRRAGSTRCMNSTPMVPQ